MSDAPTELPRPGDPEALYVVDISGYIFRAYHALPPMSSSSGETTHAVRGVTSMMLKLVSDRQPAMLGVAVDARGGTFRSERYPEYKANRDAPPPDLSQQIERVMEVLSAFEIPLLEHPGYEADDVIATLVRKGREQGLKVVIVSADKDLLQLVGDGVVMFDTMRDRVYGVPETIDKFGVPPNQVRDALALMGDSSDNVPGVPSIGPKTAAKLLEKYGTLEGIYENLEAIKSKSQKAKLGDNKEQAFLSQELVTLREDANVEVEPAALKWTGGDDEHVRSLFRELEFTRLLAQLDPAPAAAGDVETLLTLADLTNAAEAIRAAGELAIETVLSDEDPLRGDIIGVGLSWSETHGAYLPFGHRTLGAPEQLTIPQALRVLRPILENSLFPKIAADYKREALAWARHGVHLRGLSFDVSLGSYLYDPSRRDHHLDVVAQNELDAEVARYDSVTKQGRKRVGIDEVEVKEVAKVAGSRADYALRLAHLLQPRMQHENFHGLYYDLELPLAGVLTEMERVGVRIDTDLLDRMAAEAREELAALEKKAYELAGHEFNVGSPRQLETILFDELELPVIKKTKTARSTDADVLEELATMHELPQTIIDHRTIAKIEGTYLSALPKTVHPESGRVHTRYNQAVAQTGRLSSSDPNLQNIPIRTELGRKVRDAFIPADGCHLMAADYSQVELRILAHLSGDAELVDAFTKGEDVHRRTASALFDEAPEDVSYEQRGQGKTVNFAVIYGQTQFALARNLGIERSEAKRYIDAFFERYQGVKDFMDEVVEEAKNTGYVTTLLGRRRSLADIRSRNRFLRQGAERIARNTPIQGTAADLMKEAMVRIARRLEREDRASRMILTVHDELLFEVPEGEREPLETLAREEMEGVIELAVPLVVDVGWGASWGSAK